MTAFHNEKSLSRKFGSSLLATCFQDLTSTLGCHSLTEPMNWCTTSFTWLICAFHPKTSRSYLEYAHKIIVILSVKSQKKTNLLLNEKNWLTTPLVVWHLNKRFWKFSPRYNVESICPHSYPQLQVVESVESGLISILFKVELWTIDF